MGSNNGVNSNTSGKSKPDQSSLLICNEIRHRIVLMCKKNANCLSNNFSVRDFVCIRLKKTTVLQLPAFFPLLLFQSTYMLRRFVYEISLWGSVPAARRLFLFLLRCPFRSSHRLWIWQPDIWTVLPILFIYPCYIICIWKFLSFLLLPCRPSSFLKYILFTGWAIKTGSMRFRCRYFHNPWPWVKMHDI